MRDRNAEARRDVKLRGIRRYDESLLLAQIETLDSALDLCDVALNHDDTHDLALAILLRLADAYAVTVNPHPGPLD